MATTGPSAFGTAADDATVGTVAWGTPDNAKDDNNVYTSTVALADGVVTHYLKLTNPSGLSVPAGSLVSKITVIVHRKADFAITTPASERNVRDSAVRLVKSGSIGSDNKADVTTPWPTTEATATYVWEPIDTNWQGWGPSDFGATSGFVIAAFGQAAATGAIPSVDYATMTVEYTSGTTTGNFFPYMDS